MHTTIHKHGIASAGVEGEGLVVEALVVDRPAMTGRTTQRHLVLVDDLANVVAVRVEAVGSSRPGNAAAGRVRIGPTPHGEWCLVSAGLSPPPMSAIQRGTRVTIVGLGALICITLWGGLGANASGVLDDRNGIAGAIENGRYGDARPS